MYQIGKNGYYSPASSFQDCICCAVLWKLENFHIMDAETGEVVYINENGKVVYIKGN